MTTMQKAYKIRNLYNAYKEHSREEAIWFEKLYDLEKEAEKATYSKNGYEHFSGFGYMSAEEVEHQMNYMRSKQERKLKKLKEIEEKIEKLLQND